MPKAIWNGAVIAESDRCVVVEGNQYFPADSVKREYLRESDTHTVCSWKGTASYYDVVVGGQTNVRPVVFIGLAMCLVGAVRGAMLAFKYRRCPACGAFQKPKIHYPYRSCDGCGVRLSVGVKDSS